MDFIKNSPWLKAGLLAAGIDIVLTIINAFSSLIPCLGCLLFPIYCIAWLAIPLGCGYLAAMWSNLKRDQYQEAASQGALSGLVLGVVGGAVSLIVQLIFSALNLSAQSALSLFSEQENGALSQLSFLPVSIGSTVVCGSICCLIGILLDVLFSVLGGIIYVALSKDK